MKYNLQILILSFLVVLISNEYYSFKYNPILRATSPKDGRKHQCEENIYSQELFELEDGSYGMLYGGWDDTTDCHDRIFLAVSRNLGEWRKYPSDSNPVAVLDHGSSNHVNDPSVVYVNNTWFMFYTDAGNGQNDEVWLATSKTLTKFEKSRKIVGPGPKGSWSEIKVGRPVIQIDRDSDTWYLWYDGTGTTQVRCVGLSLSHDNGMSFHAYPHNPLYCGGGGIDVKKIDKSSFVLLEEGGDGVHQRTSTDGIHWSSSTLVLKSNSGEYDHFGTVVPSFFNGTSQIWFGGAQVSGWDRNNIAVATKNNQQLFIGAECTDCTGRDGGLSCSEACGARKRGVCGNIGSHDPHKCCVCDTGFCDGCLSKGISDCHEACTGMGFPGGWCANPGSTQPSKCCQCITPAAKRKF